MLTLSAKLSQELVTIEDFEHLTLSPVQPPLVVLVVVLESLS
jgi:hypothetical protein